MMLISIVTWYLAMQCFAAVGLPIAFATLHRLPSRGYATAKALGLLLTGVVFWWGGTLRLWPNTTSAILVSGGLVLTVGLLLMRDRWAEMRLWWQHHKRYVVMVEALFAVAIIGWALVRATQPQLQTAGGEKWMEIAYLNAGLRAPFMPPHDPWLSGFAISYYYLGYLLLALVTRLTGIAPTIAFNLGNAGWFALVAIQAYGIVYDMLPRNPASRFSRGRGLVRPLIAPVMLLITGNGVGLLEVLHARGLLPASFWRWLDIGRLSEPPQPPYSWVPQRFFWWWQASRTIRDITPWGDAQEVIDEFPAFSFILGDMHPHLLALPFVLVAITLALHAYTSSLRRAEDDDDIRPWRHATAPSRSLSGWTARLRQTTSQFGVTQLLGYAIVLGALGFLNTWDFPIYWTLLVGAWVLGRLQSHRPGAAEDSAAPGRWSASFSVLWQTAPEAIALGILSVVLYLPFWIALRSQAGGILPNLFNATRLQQFIVMFLPLVVPVTGLVIAAARRRSIRWWHALALGIGLTLGIALAALIVGAIAAYPYLRIILRGESVQGYTLSPDMAIAAVRQRLAHPWTGLLLAVGAGTVLLTLIRGDGAPKDSGPSHIEDSASPEGEAERLTPVCNRNAAPTVDGFALLLALIGLLLTLAPEFVYLQDIFMTRMNTIFKFYFQAWVLWSLAGAWQMCRWLDREPDGPRATTLRSPGRRRALSLTASFVLIAVGLVYTILAVPARGREQGMPGTLDGAAWLATSHPEDYAAIAWLNANVKGAPVIVEAPGDQHRAYVYEGRVSALTGLPTLLGWGGHERQWRGNYDEPAIREKELELLFNSQDRDQVQAILARYSVTYLYIGPTERGRYPVAGLARFQEWFTAVYDQDGVVIYRVDDAILNQD